jgi:GH35 family endo-1,4-beta-xylanase
LLTACAVAASLAGVPAAAAEQSSLHDLAVAHGKDFGSATDNAPHAADPDAKLYINDSNAEGLGAKSNPTYDVVSDLVAEGVPIDGIGSSGIWPSSTASPAACGRTFSATTTWRSASAAAAATGEIQLRLSKTDWSNFDETDDYSRTTETSYADASKVAVHLGGELARGI